MPSDPALPAGSAVPPPGGPPPRRGPGRRPGALYPVRLRWWVAGICLAAAVTFIVLALLR